MSWQRVRGHDALITSFQRVASRGRLAHAYLFVGPSGIGKRLFALELAKALLCEGQHDQFEGCDHCPGCALLEAGTHPDFLLMQKPPEDMEFRIALMREILDRIYLKPARGRGKVAILDDADDLNDEAANAFLKTLEEPPPGSLLVLLGTSTDRQLPTIVSRCQVVRFAPLSETLVDKVLAEQGIDDPTQRQRLAALSEGCPGTALALSDPALWEFRRDLIRCLATQPLQGVEFSRKWMEFLEEAGKESKLQRRRAALCLQLLVSLLQDALRCSVGSTPRVASAEETEVLVAVVHRIGTDPLLRLIERTLQADEQVERYLQLVLILEALMDALTQGLEPAHR